MRQRNVGAGIHFSLRQNVLQALTCLRSQNIALRFDAFNAQTQRQMSAWQPFDRVFQLQVTRKHRAIDVIDDKSQIFLYICAQQHWSWRAQHSNVKSSLSRTDRERVQHSSTRPLVRSRRKDEVVTRDVKSAEDRICVNFLISLQKINASQGHCGSRVEKKLPFEVKTVKILQKWKRDCEGICACNSVMLVSFQVSLSKR